MHSQFKRIVSNEKEFILLLFYPLFALANNNNQPLSEQIEQCLTSNAETNYSCVSQFLKPCLEIEVNQNTLGMVSCYEQSEQNWDILLNKYYQLLQKNLEPNLQKSLKDTQLVWIKYKEKTCQFEYDLWGDGSMRQTAAAGCLLRETSSRTIELYEIYATSGLF